MTNPHAATADSLSRSLDLEHAPVAVSFNASEAASALKPFVGRVPAGCSFWELGTQQAFTTKAADHARCAIGIHTHQMAGAPAAQEGELEATLQAMTGLDYVRPEEVRALPVLSQPASSVAYGPLRESPAEPDVVLIFANAAQGLLLAEAAQRVDGEPPLSLGRPACALVPHVIETGRAAVSLGCCGARAYLDTLKDDVALWGLPGARMEQFAEALAAFARANSTLAQFHRLRRADVEAGEEPSVADSLARLQGSNS